MGSDVMECDVMVIGGSLAGCWAALRASEFTPRVLLVDKGKVARSGNSPIAGGSLVCPTEEDDLSLWMEEIVERGEYMNDQDWVEILLTEQLQRNKDLDSWGVLEKDEKGKLFRFQGRSHVNTWCVGYDAFKLMETLRKLLEDRGVTIRDRVMVTDLLTADGSHPTRSSVVGAVGLDTRSAEPLTFKAKAIIIATGGLGLHGNDIGVLSGDGLGMAFRAGAEMTALEFFRWWGAWFFEKKYNVGHMQYWQNMNMVLTNSLGERFAGKYTSFKERSREPEFGAGIGIEILEGRGPIYADFRFATPEQWEWVRTNPAMRDIVHGLERAGIDLSKDRVRYDLSLGRLFGLAGGIRHNIYCETNLSGLFTAGQAAGFSAVGTFSVGALGVPQACVSGYRAGEFAAKYALEGVEMSIDSDQAKSLQETSHYPLRLKQGIKAVDLRNKIGEFTGSPKVAFFRHEQSLRKTLAEAQTWKEMLLEVRAENPHELIQANSAKNFVQFWELSIAANLERKETRGPLLRPDYPYRDDINWLKRIVQVRDGGGIASKIVPIPLYRYPVKPERYEKVTFGFQFPKIEELSI